jgi:uncharacterized membrane protein
MLTLTTLGVNQPMDPTTAFADARVPSSTPAARLRPFLVAPVLLLIVAVLALRTAGALGVAPLADWRTATRFALALMFVFTASAHFGPQRPSLVQMVPGWLPRPHLVVFATGLLELLGARGLLLPTTLPLAGTCLALLLVAMFPANIKAARHHVMIGTKPATPLWFRTVVQVVFVAALLWVSL